MFLCISYLPLFSGGVDGLAEDLIDRCDVLLHNQNVVLIFVFDDVMRFPLVLVAFVADLWWPLRKECVEVVNPVKKNYKI